MIGSVASVEGGHEMRFLIDYRKGLRIHRASSGPDAANPIRVGMVGYLLYRQTDFVVESVTEGHAVARVTRGRIVKHGDLVSIDPSDGVRDIVLAGRLRNAVTP